MTLTDSALDMPTVSVIAALTSAGAAVSWRGVVTVALSSRARDADRFGSPALPPGGRGSRIRGLCFKDTAVFMPGLEGVVARRRSGDSYREEIPADVVRCRGDGCVSDDCRSRSRLICTSLVTRTGVEDLWRMVEEEEMVGEAWCRRVLFVRFSRGVSCALVRAFTDVERREGGRGRLVGGLDLGGVGVVCRLVREGGGEAEGMYRRDRMAPMDVPLLPCCPELGRHCRMELGGPSGMGPSHRCPRGVVLPLVVGGNGLVLEVVRDGCLDWYG